MSLNLGTPETGCLLLADITGYTQYMADTELAHAQDVVADLLETIVNTIEPVFHLLEAGRRCRFLIRQRELGKPVDVDGHHRIGVFRVPAETPRHRSFHNMRMRRMHQDF